MHLNSLGPLELRPAVSAPAPQSPYAPPVVLTQQDRAEPGSATSAPSAYQAMSDAVMARDFTSQRDNFVELGRARFEDPGPPPAVVAGRDDEAYVTAGAALYRMQPDGSLTELTREKAGPLSPPALDGEGNLYYRCRTGEVVAVGPEGKELWRAATNERSVQAQNERVGFFPDGSLYAVQLEGSDEVIHGLSRAGKLDWSHKLDPGERLVGVGPGGLLFTEKHEDGGNRVLQAVQPNRWMGKRRWKSEGLSAKLPTAWVSPEGQPIVLRKDGAVVALDAEGKERWTYKGKGAQAVLPCPGGSVYVREDQQRTLTRLDGHGTVERQERTESHAFEVAVGPDGTLYTLDTDRLIHATRPDGASTEAPYPFTDTSRLQVTPGGVIYSGTRRSTIPGLKAAPNEVLSFRVRAPRADASSPVRSGVPKPVETPQDGWIVSGDISLPVRPD